MDLDTWLYLTLTSLDVLLVAGGGADRRLTQTSIRKISGTPEMSKLPPVLEILEKFTVAETSAPLLSNWTGKSSGARDQADQELDGIQKWHSSWKLPPVQGRSSSFGATASNGSRRISGL
jgi:hypothetical protein